MFILLGFGRGVYSDFRLHNASILDHVICSICKKLNQQSRENCEASMKNRKFQFGIGELFIFATLIAALFGASGIPGFWVHSLFTVLFLTLLLSPLIATIAVATSITNPSSRRQCLNCAAVCACLFTTSGITLFAILGW